MNTLLQWLTSPEWALIVKALLHSLWLGAAVALALALVLRRVSNPTARYRLALTGLIVVLLGTVIAWAVLNAPDSKRATSAPVAVFEPTPTSAPAGPVEKIVVVAQRTPAAPALEWTTWLALAWLIGASAMLGRASVKIAGAEQLRRSCRPLNNDAINSLVADAKRAVKLTRQVCVAVTDRLTSPAVVGVLVPTLILPLTLITTLTPEQIRFILLHELAHIRRGDYLANLFQLFAEALLFFNPAVWWLSHQIRREREACCDALAIQLSGAPADYAQTLVSVAETMLMPTPSAAPAFGDDREPSSLSDRVHRALVPGYRPSLRLTWRAMLGALVLGAAILTLSAIGTRVTVAAATKLLTPEERMDRIEQKMVEYGQNPGVAMVRDEHGELPQVEVKGRLRMRDESPLPKLKNPYLSLHSFTRGSSTRTGALIKPDGSFQGSVPCGIIWAGVEVPGCAPALVGPIDGTGTNPIMNLDLVADSGFSISIEATDADSGLPVREGSIRAQFWLPGTGSSFLQPRELVVDSAGNAKMPLCLNAPLKLTLNAPGYEIIEQRFDTLTTNQVLQLKARRGGSMSGMVLSKGDGQPVAGATLHLLYQDGPMNSGRYDWGDGQRVLATTGQDGRFLVNQLRRDSRYSIGVTAPGRESFIFEHVLAGQSNLIAQLGPELIIRGRVTGNLDLLNVSPTDKRRFVRSTVDDSVGGQRSSNGRLHEVRMKDGVGYFQITNRVAGWVELAAGGNSSKRMVDAPVDDWLIELSEVVETNKPAQKREVVLRFEHPSGVAPKGTVYLTVPERLDTKPSSYVRKELEIVDGEVRANSAVGAYLSYEPARTVGYWFKECSHMEVTAGLGPLVIEVPVVPAGAIYAKARNADGTEARELFFGVRELKRAPQRDANSSLGNFSDSFDSATGPRKWVSGPLPLGGTYQVYGWRGNSFCLGESILLTETKPDAEIELQFPLGRKFFAVVLNDKGQPLSKASVEVSFQLPDNHGFQLKRVFTDERGTFQLEQMTPGVGDYFVQVNAPGQMSERIKLNFEASPQIMRLRRGHTLAGRVVEAGTGYPIPGMEIRALDYERHTLPMLTTHTDAQGRFVFTTLGDVKYTLYPDGGELIGRPTSGNLKVRADGSTNLLLEVKLYEWSKLVPVAPKATATNAAVPPSPATTGRQQIVAKMERIRLDSVVFDSMPLSEVTRFLAGEVKRQDPDKVGLNFIIAPSPTPETQPDPATGLPTTTAASARFNPSKVLITVRPPLQKLTLREVIDVIVKVSPEPIAYSVQDYGIEIKPVDTNAIPLHTRIFNVDSNAFARAIAQFDPDTTSAPPSLDHSMGGGLISILKPNHTDRTQAATLSFFNKLGVDFSPPKGVFFNDRQGKIFIRATMADLDIIERAIQRINEDKDPRSSSTSLSLRPQSGPQWSAGHKIDTGGPIQVREDGDYEWFGAKMKWEQTREVLAVSKTAFSKTELEVTPLTNAAPEAVARLIQTLKELEIPFRQSPTTASTNLHTRTFKVDPNTIVRSLTDAGQLKSNNIGFSLREFFVSLGADFQPPKAFYYNDQGGLFVRASLADLDIIEQALQVANASAPQVNIQVKFVEVLPEVALPHNLGSIAKTNDVGSASTVLTRAECQSLLKVLEKEESVDILTAASVTTLSGRQAQLQIVDIQTAVTGGVSPVVEGVNTNDAHSTPLPFGPTLEVIPYVSVDGQSIQMVVIPTITEFLGYQRYTNGGRAMATGDSTVSPGMPLPHFRVRQITTTPVVVRDGQTIVLGGMQTEDSSGHPEKVPVLGDLPFHTNSIKKNLLIFITPTIVDPAGNRIHAEGEKQPVNPAAPNPVPVDGIHVREY